MGQVQVQEFFPETGWSDPVLVQLDPLLSAQDMENMLLEELVSGCEYV